MILEHDVPTTNYVNLARLDAALKETAYANLAVRRARLSRTNFRLKLMIEPARRPLPQSLIIQRLLVTSGCPHDGSSARQLRAQLKC